MISQLSLNIIALRINCSQLKEKKQQHTIHHLCSFLFQLFSLDIIKLFNPGLLGAAPGKTVHGMQGHISETGFNLAVTGHNTL